MVLSEDMEGGNVEQYGAMYCYCVGLIQEAKWLSEVLFVLERNSGGAEAEVKMNG